MDDKPMLFKRADALKEAINKARPLSEKELKNLQEYFKIGLTYTSNAIEGNTLTESETKILLEDGLTVGGKPIKDYYEAIGHAKAYEYMLNESRKKPLLITEEIVKQLHFLFYNSVNNESAGKYRKEQNFITGTEYLTPSPDKVPSLMHSSIEKLNRGKASLHPIEYAALMHKALVDIHPFEDGNGRTARLVMNLILINEGYGIAIIPPVLRGEYIDTLKISQREKNPDNDPFIKLIVRCVIETQKDYCRLLNIPVPGMQRNKEK